MRLLHITFKTPLERQNIAGFRASVARAAGLEQDLFHNHLEDGSVQYRYPMVQYRSERGNAAIIGLDEGADAIYNWYIKCEGKIFWNDAEHPLPIYRLDMREHSIRYNDGLQTYRLYQWLALNQNHYRTWANMTDLAARAAELDRILVAHILTFCRAVNWRLPERFEAAVVDIGATYRTRLMGNDLMAFDLTFRSNLYLPAHIGLGKGVSHGFGVCVPVRVRIKMPGRAGSANK
jgi:hypothetical protein